MNHFLYHLLSMPKTILFNFLFLPFNQSFRLPIFFGIGFSFHGLKRGRLHVQKTASPLSVRFDKSFGSLGVSPNLLSSVNVLADGQLTFLGSCLIGEGSNIVVEHGEIIFGNGFRSNKNLFLYIRNKLIFGKDCMVGWNVSIQDNDGHGLFPRDNSKRVLNPSGGVVIGDHVWLCSNVFIKKGVTIADHVVVGSNSVVAKSLLINYAVFGGVPARPLKTGIEWLPNSPDYSK